jgi:hypothetical protein
MRHRFAPPMLAAIVAAGAVAVLPATSGGSTVTAASGCHWAGFRIYQRQNVSCSRAQTVLHNYYGGSSAQDNGWNCDTTNAAYTKGHCKKASKKFKFEPR